VPTEDIDKAIEATQKAAQNMRQFAKAGTQVVSEAVAIAGQQNLDRRHGGGRYSLSVSGASTRAAENRDGWAAVLDTPWLGMEFGGYLTFFWGFRAGTGWEGVTPMWAPTLRGDDRGTDGYILGAAWTELNKSGEPSEAVVAATLAGWVQEFESAGLNVKETR